MEKEWMKLIDTEVNESTSCHHVHGDIVDYVREQATIEDKRAIVQEVERRVKEVVNREENNLILSFAILVNLKGICLITCCSCECSCSTR